MKKPVLKTGFPKKYFPLKKQLITVDWSYQLLFIIKANVIY
jgi:hypothetical protein